MKRSTYNQVVFSDTLETSLAPPLLGQPEASGHHVQPKPHQSIPDCAPIRSRRPVEPSEARPALSVPKLKTSPPWIYFRRIRKLCKVLLTLYVMYLVLFGQPQYIFQGLYQGFVHGWDSECADWYRCRD